MGEFDQQVITEFRANGGKVGGYFEGMDLILLTTKGAKSGVSRIVPLVVFTIDDELAIVGSKGGAPTHPDWYHNLLANPDVSIEMGTEQFNARATPLSETKRAEAYIKVVEAVPGFGDYEKKTTRVIPVVKLERIP